MISTLHSDQIETLHNNFYEGWLKKPSVIEDLRKSLSLFSKRTSNCFHIKTSTANNVFTQNMRCNPCLDVKVISYAETSQKMKLVRDASTMIQFNRFKQSIESLTEGSRPEYFIKAMHYFIASFERMMGKDFTYLCEQVDDREFYFVSESDSLLMSTEISILV